MNKDIKNQDTSGRIRSFFGAFPVHPKSKSDFLAVIPAFKITILYLIFSVLWIVISDNVVDALLPDKRQIFSVGLFKGILFVTLTSFFVFYLIAKELNNAAKLKSDKEKVDAALSNTNILLSAFLEGSPEIMVYALDRNYRYSAFNKRYKHSMLQEAGKEIAVESDALALLSDESARAQRKAEYDRALSGDYFSVIDPFGDSEDARSYWQRSYSPIFNSERDVIGLTCFIFNITPLKKAQEKNLYISYHDMLTGLYNRRYVEEHIKTSNQMAHLPFSIIIGDVNGLKLLNDAFGHPTGDLILRKGADVISEQIGKRGIVARWGNDEFIILLPNTDSQEAEAFTSELKRALLNTNVHSVVVDISFGTASKTLAEESILSVIKTAEDRMHKSKIAESKSMRNTMIKTIMSTLHEKNPREEAHSKRVGALCKNIGKELNLSESEVNLLNIAGFLHDIGKIAIDERLLGNSAVFSEQEIELIRLHPEIGCRILRSSYDVSEIAEAVLYHHERWDGTGYPKGLKGAAIPFYARVIAIANHFDAMISKRTDKKPRSIQDAADAIQDASGTLFDPHLVEAFMRVLLNYEWENDA